MDISLLDLVNLHQLGAVFYESIVNAAANIERRIQRTPTTSPPALRSTIWNGVIFKNILPSEVKGKKAWGGK